MNRILNATKLDFYSGKSTLKMTALLMLFAVVIGAVSKGPVYTMLFTMIFAVMSCGTVFSVHEKNHSDKLYGILPLKKTEMIVGRYLYALIIGVVYAVVAGFLGFVMLRITGAGLDSFSFWGALMLGFIYFSFAVGISYPIYLKFSFAKAYVFTMLPMYLIAVFGLILTRRTNIINIGQIFRFFKDNQILIPIFGILVVLILLSVSALIANLIYTRKEI